MGVHLFPERVSPGNLISFLFNQAVGSPTPGNSNNPTLQTAGSTIIGPFRILSLGARTGDRNQRQAYTRSSSGKETLIGISFKVTEGALDPEAEKLFQILGNNARASISDLALRSTGGSTSPMKIWYNKIHESRRALLETEEEVVHIGRDAANLLVLKSPLVAKRQAIVRFEEGKLTIENVGLNSCMVGERELMGGEQTEVPAGETLRIWPYTLTFEMEQGSSHQPDRNGSTFAHGDG